MAGSILFTDIQGGKTSITIDGITDKTKLKAFAQEFDNLTIASVAGYRVIPEPETDISSLALDGEYYSVKDRFIATFDVVKVSGGKLETVTMMIPAPDATNVTKAKNRRNFDPAVGATLATALKTATGYDKVTYTGANFKTPIMRD